MRKMRYTCKNCQSEIQIEYLYESCKVTVNANVNGICHECYKKIIEMGGIS